ncbi:MAG: CBS domain-containing protein [Desulfobacterales bacterium]|nr:CBS domain-containing protein [Desulfobacterales bacterium]
MVPLAEYATVGENATLFDAVITLEKAQADFDHTRYRHRAVLVVAADGHVVGKISQLDALKALEPKYSEMASQKGIQNFGFSKSFTVSLLKSYGMWSTPLTDLCRKAMDIKVREVMHRPSEGEFVEEEASLDQAVHQLVMGHHQSLLVAKGDKITGILRLTDVFSAVFHVMKACQTERSTPS